MSSHAHSADSSTGWLRMLWSTPSPPSSAEFAKNNEIQINIAQRASETAGSVYKALINTASIPFEAGAVAITAPLRGITNLTIGTIWGLVHSGSTLIEKTAQLPRKILTGEIFKSGHGDGGHGGDAHGGH